MSANDPATNTSSVLPQAESSLNTTVAPQAIQHRERRSDNDSAGSKLPLWKVTLRGIKSQFGRFLMTLLAVSIGTAFLTGVLGLREALSGIAASAMNGVAVYDGYVLGPEETSPAGTISYGSIDTSVVSNIKDVAGTEGAIALRVGTGLLYDADGNLIQTFGLPVFLTTTLDGSKGPTWLEGEAPTGAGEIALERTGAEQAGLKNGDQVELATGGQILEQKIVGIYEFDHDLAGAITIAIDDETAATLLGDESAPMAAFNINSSASQETVLQQVKEAVNSDYTVMDNAEYTSYLKSQSETMLGFITTFLLVFIAIALFVSTFIIFNTFQMSVRARTKEFALLRAIGASSSQVFWVVAWQAVFVGIVGGALGVLIGRGLDLLTEDLMKSSGMLLSDGIPLTSNMIIISMVVALVVTMISAILPALQAGNTAPVQAMRDSEGANPKPLWPRTVIGAVTLVLGLVGVWLGATRAVSADGLAFGLGAALVVLGLLMTAAGLSGPVMVVLSQPIRLVARTQGRLAVKNMGRNPRRTAVTAGALIIGVGLVSAGLTLAASVKDSVASVTENQLLADLVVQSAAPFSPIPEGAVAAIEDVPGVASVDSEVGGGMVSVVDPDGQTLTQTAAFMNPDYIGKNVNLPFTEGSAAGLNDGGVLVLKSFAEEYGYEVGDSLVFKTTSGDESHEIIGLVETNISTSTFIFSNKFESLAPAEQSYSPAVLYVWTDAGSDIATVKADITEQIQPFRTISVGDVDDVVSSISKTIDQVMNILYALLGLSVFVAALGIINTLTLSISERTREFGLLRAVGMGRGGIGGMVLIESVLTSIYAAILGIALGVGLSAALRVYLADEGLSVLSIPWATIGLLLVGSVLLGILAAALPAWRASRFPVLEAIQSN